MKSWPFLLLSCGRVETINISQLFAFIYFLSLFQFLAAAQGGTPSHRLIQPAGEIPTRNHEPGVTQLESFYLKLGGRPAPARGLGLAAAC